MTRFILSTCGLIVDLAAFETAAPTYVVGLAFVGLAVTAIAFWGDLNRFAGQIIGLDRSERADLRFEADPG